MTKRERIEALEKKVAELELSHAILAAAAQVRYVPYPVICPPPLYYGPVWTTIGTTPTSIGTTTVTDIGATAMTYAISGGLS